MAYPSDLARTKDWGTEVLTDTDLEGQFDLIITWLLAALNSSTGHDHSGTANKSKKIDLTAGVTGNLPGANQGGAQSIDGIKTYTSFPIGPSSAPTTNYQFANKKYVDDLEFVFGDLVNKSADYGNQVATENGFVCVKVVASLGTDTNEWVDGFTGATSDPTTTYWGASVGRVSSYSGYTKENSFTMPVKKGHYWKVAIANGSPTVTVAWIPFALAIS